jgi:hypothetical protein
MLELTIKKIEVGNRYPIILRPWEIDDKGHNVGSIRNAIDIMKKTNPPVVKRFEIKGPQYQVKFSLEGIEYLEKETKIWDDIQDLIEIDTLTIVSLEVLREVIDKVKRLIV